MLSRCVSRVLLFIASFVARRLGWPVERYFSADRGCPLLQLSFTGVKFQVRRLTLLQNAWNEILLQAGLQLHIQKVLIEYVSLKLSLCGPLVLEVRGLYALASTTHERYYDASREAQSELEHKKMQLAEIEAEEGKAAVVTQGWFKKKAIQFLKWIAFKLLHRLQVSVENVHVRLEDKLSSPAELLALGCTLRQLSLKESQKESHPPMAISVKDVAVTELAVYWNVNTENLMSELPNAEIEARLQATPFTEVVGYSYVLKPCSLSSSLQAARGVHSLVNVTVGAELTSATLRVSMYQLQSVIEFLGFFKHLQTTRHFLQFKPVVPLTGHAREWWHYAFKSVVESIRQSRGAWLWQELREQRELCREYELRYEELLIAEKSTSKILNSLLEKMSLLSIVLSRRKVEKGLRLRRLLSDLADHWAGKAKRTSSQKTQQAVQSPLLLTTSVDCCVRELQLLLVEDEETQDQVLKLDLQNTRVKLLQQPKEVRIDAKLQSLTCSGLATSDGSAPILVSKWNRNQAWSPADLGDEEKEKGDSPLLKAEFVSYLKQAGSEAGLDFEAEVALQPLVLIFDKETALKLAEVVSLFRNSHEDLQSIVKEKVHQIKYQNKKKIKKVVAEKKLVGLIAEVWLPLILVPENGNIASSDRCLAVNPGYLEVKTKGMPEQHSVQYSAQLSWMSVCLLEDGKNWSEALQPGVRPSLKHQLLSSGNVSLSAEVTVPTSDQELQPSTHATVAVPQVSINLSNSSLEEGVGLVSQQVVALRELQRVALKTNTKKLAKKSPTPPVYTHHSPSANRIMDDAGRIRSGGRISRQNVRATRIADESIDFEDLSFLSISCKIDKISLCISESQDSGPAEVEYLYLSAAGVEARAEQRKDAMLASVRVGSLGLRDLSGLTQDKETPVQIISTEEDFISVKICMADVSSLYFKTEHDSVKTDVTVNVAPCCLSIYEDSLLHLLKFVLGLKLQHSIRVMFDVVPTGELPAPPIKQVHRWKQPHQLRKDISNTRVRVQFANAVLELCTTQPIVDLKVSGIEAEVVDTAVRVDATASVQNISLTDSLQTYKDYREVVANKPVENFLQFKCVLKKALQDEPMDDPGTGIRLETSITVGEITAILLFKFVRTMQLYTLHLVHETLRMWKDMGTQWRTVGQQQGIDKAQPLPPVRVFKYHVSVDVHPVELVVPKQSSSLEQLVLKLRNMHLANTYEFAKQNATATISSITGASHHTLLEKITLEIDQLSLTRHAPDGTPVSTLANDPEIRVSLLRVVAGQNTSQSQLSARMDIGEIQGQLSDDDIRTVPDIILNNLSEEEPLHLSYESSSSTATVKSPSETVLEDSSTSMDLVDVVVKMGRLKCILSMLKPDMLTLCEIGLTQLSTQICYCSDSSLKVSGSLQDISLVDPADKGSVIVKGSRGQVDTPVIEIAMKLEPNKEMEVDAKLKHIHAYIWPTLTANFLKFTRASIPEFEEKPKSDSASAVDDEDAVFEEHSLKLSAVLTVDDLSLALLEASNSLPSYGVCVELHPIGTQTHGMKLEFNLAPSELQLLCDSFCFEVSICYVNEETAKLVQVVDPCCLQLSYLSSSAEETATLEASKLVIFLTNEAIKTISGPVMECIQLLKHEIKGPEQSQVKLSGNIWEVRNIDRDKELEKLKALRDEESETIPKEKRRLLPPKKKQQATLNLPEVVVDCNVLYAGDSTSLLCLTTAIEAGVNSWTTELAIDAQLKADAFVYNYRVAAWEPLLEPMEDPTQECYRPWTMVTKVRQVSNLTSTAPTHGPISISSGSDSHEGDIPPSPSFLPVSRGSATPSQLAEDIALSTVPKGSESSGHVQHDDGGGKTVVVVLSSDDRLELTVSPGAIHTLQDLVNSLGKDGATVKEHLANCIHENRLSMLIKNETGLNVIVFPGPTFKPLSFSAPILLSSVAGKNFPTEASSALGKAAPDTKTFPGVAGDTCSLAYCSLKELSYLQECASGDSSSSDESDEEDECEDEENDYENEEEEKAEEKGDEGEELEEKEVDGDEGEKGEVVVEEAHGDEEGKKDEEEKEGVEEEEEMKGLKKDLPDSSKEIADCQLKKVLKIPQKKQKKKYETIPGSVHGKASLLKRIKWKPKSLSKNHMIRFQAEGGKKSKEILVSLPAMTPISLYLPPPKGSLGGKVVKGVCEVKVEGGVRTLTIRSRLQVKNTLSYPVSLHALVDGTRRVLFSLEQGKSYDVPVQLMACGCPLQVDVINASRPSNDVLDWKELIRTKSPVVLESVTHGEHIFFQAVVERHLLVHRREHISNPAYVILLQPALSLQNLLPLPAELTIQGSYIEDVPIAPGETKDFYKVDLRMKHTFVFQLPKYHELKWVGEASLGFGSHGTSKIRMNGFIDFGHQVDKMYLTIHSDAKHPSLFQLYCPYWIVNKTGLPLEYEHQPSRWHKSIRSSDSGSPNSVTLIYYKPSVEKKHRKLKLRLPEGHWSQEIALSATGKGENLSSDSTEGVPYEFGIQNRLSGSILTHCLYVLPRFNVINNTKVPITCLAYNSDRRQPDVQHSVIVGANELKPFWNGVNQDAVLILEDTQPPTKPFSLEQFSTTVLATSKEDELSGLIVRVQPDTTNSCVLISVSPYMEGSAPIRVDNLCHDLQIEFTQQCVNASSYKHSEQHHTLSPGQSKLYTWDEPSGKKQLQWKVIGEGEGEWTPLQYSQGKKHGSRMVRVAGSEEMVTCYWKVGYDGSQLVFRLFDDAQDYQLAVELHSPTSAQLSVQLFCSLEGVGLSLINSTPFEVVYACILSSPAVWLKRRPDGESHVIEPEESVRLEVAWRTSDGDVEINGETYDLKKMQILSSKGGSLSRVFNPGVWVWASTSEQQYSLNVKLGRLQLDNQLRDYEATNRIVLAAETSQAPQEAIAPFLDAMVIVSKPSKGQKVIEVEKAFMEVKTIHLNIELGLITALFSLAESFLKKKLIARLAYNQKLVERPLSDILKVHKGHTSAHFKKFQLAPLKITVTFTTAGDYDISGLLGQIADSIVHFTSLFTEGSMTIELGAIEIVDETHDLRPLLSIILNNYKHEILRHIYSVAFGLDIIGNPARLLKSFKVGAKDFISESRKGLDEGELGAGVLGVAEGVEGFLGHVIEGSVESVTSISGAFQTSLLSITDIDYRTMHRRRSQAAEGFTDNFLLGTKFFAEGIFHGLTDIVAKPMKGAEMEGVKGFLKGLGAGALSILTKPTLGVIDLVHFTLEGIRSAVDDDPEQQVVRLTRFIHHNKVITPFNTHEAQGLHILWSVLQFGKESYYGHEWLPAEQPRVFLVSSLHLFRLKRDGRQFDVDDWSAKVEYLEDWEVIPEESVDGPALHINYGDDTFLDKVAFKLFNYEDHKAEIHKAITFPMATEAAAQHLGDTITEAWKDSKWNLKAPNNH